MNRLFLYRSILLLLLFMAGENRLSAQFLRTRISLPPGIELVTRGLPDQIIPQENSLFSATSQMAWVELRAMVNLQVVVEYQLEKALIPTSDDLMVLNDGSEDFSHVHSQDKLGFVLLENTLKSIRRATGLRPYSAWLGFPYQSRGITTIHYP